MKVIEDYSAIVQQLLKTIMLHQQPSIAAAASKLARLVDNGGVIYLFGCGHSHIFAEDVFYRAGGLAPVRPVFIEPLMLHQGAAASSDYEKQNGYIDAHLAPYNIGKQDALIVISTSGINPAPIDAARWASARGAFTLALTSFRYAQRQSSRHIKGYILRDCVDIAIDNYVPAGDAVLTRTGYSTPFAPVSSVVGIFILQTLFAATIASLNPPDKRLPVFLSGNIAHADEHNKRLLALYGEKIPELIANSG